VILGAFAKLRKATISCIMSVCPSIRLAAWKNSAPIGRMLMKLIFELLSKMCRENSNLIKI
jgi:hypothetical protein